MSDLAAAAAAVAGGEPGGTYFCSKCGQLKKGHTCPVVATKQMVVENLPMMLPTNTMTTRRAYQQNLQMHKLQQQQHQDIQQQQRLAYLQQQQQMGQQQTQMVNQQPQQQPQQPGVVGGYPRANMVPNGAPIQQPILTGPILTQNEPLSAEQKRIIEKKASDFNLYFLLERQERNPYYFDPHTKTIQVVGSWYINVADSWNTMTPQEKKALTNHAQKLATTRSLYLQRQHDIQNLQVQLAKIQQSQQAQAWKYEVARQQREKLLEEMKQDIPKVKAAVTPFFHYLNENRDIEKRNHPDLILSDISKLVGNKWKTLTDEEKQPYYEKSAEDKKRYEIEYAEYTQKIKDLADNLPPIDISTIPDPPIDEQANVAIQQQQQQQQPPNQTAPTGIATAQTPAVSELKKSLSTTTLTCENCHQNDNREQLLQCVSCLRSFHGKCIQLQPIAIETIKKSNNWKCIDCKVCETCKDTGGEDKMLFCDVCDKGYHTYCLSPPLATTPTGGWRCTTCVFCIHCGNRTPGNNANSQWKGHFTECEACHSLVNDRKYCSICRKVIKPNEKNPTIQCGYCERWTHSQCDGISDSNLEKFKDNPNHLYKCQSCRNGHQKTIPKPLVDPDEDEEEEEEEERPEPPTRKRRSTAATAAPTPSKRGRKKVRKDESDEEMEDEDDDVNVDD